MNAPEALDDMRCKVPVPDTMDGSHVTACDKILPCPDHPVPLTATAAQALLTNALSKPPLKFPFDHRSRHEIAYHLLVWELLKLVERSPGECDIGALDVIKCMTRAAGELS